MRARESFPVADGGPVAEDRSACRRCVRVWFGRCVVCEHLAEAAEADAFEAAMRRFAGLRVTNEPVRSAA